MVCVFSSWLYLPIEYMYQYVPMPTGGIKCIYKLINGPRKYKPLIFFTSATGNEHLIYYPPPKKKIQKKKTKKKPQKVIDFNCGGDL